MKVCLKCVNEEHLSNFIQEHGERNECSHCHEQVYCVDIKTLAKEIERVLLRDFQVSRVFPTLKEKLRMYTVEGTWRPPGKMLTDLIGELAGIEKQLSDRVITELKRDAIECRVSRNVWYGYSGETYWERRPPSETGEDKAWDEFCESLKHQSRFFSEERGQILKKLLGNMDRASRAVGEPLIERYSPGSRGLEIWRGRIAHSIEEVKNLLKSPVTELGAPPKEKTQQGRMNAKGIPTLYGALDWETCVAELRAPVGAHVVLGKFTLIDDINLLNLSQLGKGDTETSRFSPTYEEDLDYAGFLGRLVDKMCAPVVAPDEALDYLPTQIVAEYLATRKDDPCDGVLFPSIQTGRMGMNIALFARACGVAMGSSEMDINVEVEVDFVEGHPVSGDHDFAGFWRKEILSKEEKMGVIDKIRFGQKVAKHHKAPKDTLTLSELKVVKVDKVEYSYMEYDQLRPYTFREDKYSEIEFGG